MDSLSQTPEPKPEPEKKPQLPQTSSLETQLQEFSRNIISDVGKKAINKYLDPSTVLAGLRFTPLICKDHECPYKKHCPLHLTGEKRPTGDPCPVELMKMAISIQSRVAELNIKPEHFTDLEAVAEIAQLDVLIARSQMEISDAKLTIENSVGIDAKGHPMVIKVLNPAVQAFDKFVLLKSRKLKELEATRRAKREAGEIQGRTDAINLSNIDKLLRDASKTDKDLRSKYVDTTATFKPNEDKSDSE